MVCTHLGCLYKWEPSNSRFECPCHGSKFSREGHYIEGPAPRSLDQFVIKVKEGDRERAQVFEGVVLRRRGRGPGESFTVRRVTHAVGVERTFLVHSPIVQSVKIVRHGKVRRARLYYLRGLSGRSARIREDRRRSGR